MHIKRKFKNRIIAMFMCILLLSNLGLNVVLATSETDSKGTGAGVSFGGPGQTGLKISESTTTATYNDEAWGGIERIVVEESGAYTVNVATNQGEVTYEMVDSAGAPVRLAAEYKNGKYTILTDAPSTNKTTATVILEEGKEYYILFTKNGVGDLSTVNDEPATFPVVVSMTKNNLPKLGVYATNISSHVVTAKSPYNHVEFLEQYNSRNVKIHEFTQEEIDDYILFGQDDGMTNGGWLEGILVDIVVGLGTMFTFIVEKIIGANTELTIDNIIFNKLDQTVIDLTPLGGIQVGASGKGIFYQSEVGETINILFNALKTLAIGIYLVMFLYIGVKILMSIGGADQKKYFKYIEYWLTGLIILSILPYFLPAIPSISNSIVEMMADKAKQINGRYSTKEILARLGYNTSYLGEDAEIVELESLIDEKIAALNSQMKGSSATKEEAQSAIDSKIKDALMKFSELTDAEKASIESEITTVKNFVDENFDTWDDSKQATYEQYVNNVRDEVLSSASVSAMVSSSLDNIPDEVKNDPEINAKIWQAVGVGKSNITKGNKNSLEYERHLSELKTIMAGKGLSTEYSNCASSINKVINAYSDYTKTAAFTNLEKLFSDYKDAVIQQEIDELQEMKNMLARDVMTRLKQNAQSKNRLVYAIAWAILLFQMFAILFLYYKRLFAIIILIVIFPLVMSFYVIDKIGDGESQSLKMWLNEIIANCLVQVLHAAIYIILVNIGIEACEIDPDKNWFILILTVCFLFPGERILRGILGLKASTLGELKNNFAGVAIGVGAVRGMARNTYREAKSFVKDGGVKGVKEKWQKELEASEEKKKAKKKLHDSRERSKAYRDERIADGTASKFDKLVDSAGKVKAKIGDSEVGRAAKYTISKIASNKYLKGTLNLAKATGKYGKFTLKKVGKVARRGVGLTVGAMEGMENFGDAGLMSSVATNRKVAKEIGGFQDRQKVINEKETKKNEQNTSGMSESTASKFTTKYNNGQRVSGSGRITPGNVNNNSSTSASRSISANKIKTKLNVNVNPNNNTP